MQPSADLPTYDEKYFQYQRKIGEIGGWANRHKFKSDIDFQKNLLDFGCGGGYLLNYLKLENKFGIEPNAVARESAQSFGITCFNSADEALTSLGPNSIDQIISNHALEHATNPLHELITLNSLLKPGGSIHFFVPCDSILNRYKQNDQDMHLFTWSPQNLANLFSAAGFRVLYSQKFVHRWPPKYRLFAKLGWPLFNAISYIFGHIDRRSFQVQIRATRD